MPQRAFTSLIMDENGNGNNTELSPIERQKAGLRPPWPKGVSGNPHGRPKKLTRALDEALTPQEASMVAKAIIRAAKRGNVKAFDSLADRVEGKVPQAITGMDGGPLKMRVEVVPIGGTFHGDNGNS